MEVAMVIHGKDIQRRYLSIFWTTQPILRIAFTYTIQWWGGQNCFVMPISQEFGRNIVGAGEQGAPMSSSYTLEGMSFSNIMTPTMQIFNKKHLWTWSNTIKIWHPLLKIKMVIHSENCFPHWDKRHFANDIGTQNIRC